MGLASGGELTGLARRVCAIKPYAFRKLIKLIKTDEGIRLPY